MILNANSSYGFHKMPVLYNFFSCISYFQYKPMHVYSTINPILSNRGFHGVHKDWLEPLIVGKMKLIAIKLQCTQLCVCVCVCPLAYFCGLQILLHKKGHHLVLEAVRNLSKEIHFSM